MRTHFTHFAWSLILGISFANNLIAQSNNTENLKRFTKADYDVVSNNHLFSDIDFYNANEVTLYRELRGDEITAANGTLKVINNVRYEYITLPQYNVGRCRSYSYGYTLRISFDARHPERSFEFYMDKSRDGDQLFYLKTIEKDNRIAVSYGGETYLVLTGPGFSSSGTNFVFLLFDNTKQVHKESNQDTLKSFPSRRQN